MTSFRHTARASAVAGVLAVGPLAFAQTAGTPPAPSKPDYPKQQAAAGAPEVTEAQETEMMAMHQKMMAEMKAKDAELEALVTKMNAATGDAKIEAMADAIAAIVEGRTAMRERMMTMQSRMMGHMMRHTSAGMSAEGKKRMSACPMMKQMGGATEK